MREESLATAGRAVKQHPVGQAQAVLLCLPLVTNHPNDSLVEALLKGIYSSHISKSTLARFALPDLDGSLLPGLLLGTMPMGFPGRRSIAFKEFEK